MVNFTSDNTAARNPKYQPVILDSDQNICFILHFAIKLQNIYAWKLTIYFFLNYFALQT